ncbi:S9 family peptidase [Burkholderia anthina]|uniref:S9 family peptidase n=1 Tax=Burkholderia anthina TaxID=179879 RepID=UPI001FC8476D|nr:prolyl oligopeptidase family serine peptidase [Burkholderia anthina]
MNARKPDPLSASDAVAVGREFVELATSDAGLFWNEYRPDDGACRIWHWTHGTARCVTPDGFSVRSRVYEYGGGAFCLANDAIVFVNERNQQLYRQPLDGGVPQLLTHGERRYGDIRHAHGLVLAVEETRDVHRLVAIAISDGRRHVLAQGADFYAAPSLSMDGRRLAWIEWQRPRQPWTATRLQCAERVANGDWSVPRVVAGLGDDEALQQPQFDAHGNLCCLTDRLGYWQPWSETAAGLAPLPAAPGDHAPAPWQLGERTWLPLDGGTYVATWTENDTGVLGIGRPDGTMRMVAREFSRFRSLAVDAEHVYCVAASPGRTSAIISIRRDDHRVTVLAGGDAPIPDNDLSLPVAFRFRSGDGEAYGYFHPPTRHASPRPPLVVSVHGGPTSANYPVFDPKVQYWTQRGFAVANLNYRGSTGYGRAYRQALRTQWGILDVEDACNVVAHLGAQGLIDPARAFVRGSSAGGYTALCSLAFHRVFRAGASLYGVSDPAALGKVTHKFEADYLDWLIGDPTADAERYRARTPLLHAASIRVPVVFFQGAQDTVVVPAQTRAMCDALRENGIPAEAHYYADERHGFRVAANQAHALDTEWRFYRKVLETT